MPKKLRITAVPPGPAPLAIRKQWVGIDIPIDEAAVEHELRTDPAWAYSKVDGYYVMALDAIQALTEAERFAAAFFWDGMPVTMYRFNKNCGEIIEA
ncbi:MAG: hypothetical protein IPJ68_03080 [Candidatus Moraniibacteriota bacterium]|nr:MAG: hypothetical protein IPJ68_03080 [Candidatus Moranbacteria bacterium]